MTRRRGSAIVLVLILLLVVFPLVTALFLRSHTALQWVGKLHYQQQARALAEEGEAAAYAWLASGGGARIGARPTADGGMEYRIVSLGVAPGGQQQFLVAAEGLFQGEERMVISVAEVSGLPGSLLLIPRDRSWLLPVPGGGAPLTSVDLVSQHTAKTDAYLAQLTQESAMDATSFVNRMRTQSDLLDCPEIASSWSVIASGLSAAKAPPPP